MRRIAGIVVVVLTAATPVPAQGPAFKPSANPVTDAVRNLLARESKNLIASAELLHADRYGYRPTPAQMTFGQLMAHIVQTNLYLCAAISGLPSPMTAAQLGQLNESGGKEKLLPMLRQSFEFCSTGLARVTDAQLGGEVSAFGRAMGQSRAAALVTIAVDWSDHYSTAAGYLRLNGILPPSAPPAK